MNARFAPGARVTVRAAYPPGHIRTPFYIRGKTGVIERTCGAFPNPEERAFGRDGLPACTLYRVRFRQRDVWPDYAEDEADTLDVEIFEHWLEEGDPWAITRRPLGPAAMTATCHTIR